ncbi:MAG: sodium:solute symporter, partial [Armatimonadota bacterium]|nr:sodium:solute symporter [Armatimonadota bacterium]
ADLVCVAAATPTFLGLYARRLAGWAAATSALAGIAAGALFFPDPGFTRGHLLTAFLLAAAVPSLLATLLQLAGQPADLERLRTLVRPLDEPRGANPRS